MPGGYREIYIVKRNVLGGGPNSRGRAFHRTWHPRASPGTGNRHVAHAITAPAAHSSQTEDQAQGRIHLAQLLEGEMPGRLPSRFGSTAAVCSARTRVRPPTMATSGRKVAARAAVEVGATSHVVRGSRSDWTTTA